MKLLASLLVFFVLLGEALGQTPPAPPPASVLGGAVSLAVTNTTARVALPASPSTYPAVTLFNEGTQLLYFAYGNNTVIATTSSIPLAPGTSISIWIGAATNVAAITASSTTTLRVYQLNGSANFKNNNSSGGLPSSIPLGNLAQTGATLGQVMGWDGSSWNPSSAPRLTSVRIGGATIQQPSPGTYNLNVPASAGVAGQVRTSGGGLSAPETWTTLAPVAITGSASDIGSGTLIGAVLPAFSGDLSSGGNTAAVSVLKVNGVSLSGTPAAGYVPIASSSSAAAWSAQTSLISSTLTKTSNYTITSADDGVLVSLGGSAQYTLTFPNPVTLNSNHKNYVYNGDTTVLHGKIIDLSAGGGPVCMAWPGQIILVYRNGTAWNSDCGKRWNLGTLTATSTLTDFYINCSTGSDANDGLSTGTAWKNLPTVSTYLNKFFDLQTSHVTVNIAAGTCLYTGEDAFHYAGKPTGGEGTTQILIRGAGSSLTTVGTTDNSNAFAMFYNAQVQLESLAIETGTMISGGGACLSITKGGRVTVNTDVKFLRCAAGHMVATTGGQIYASGDYKIAGDAASHSHCSTGALISNTSTITLLANITVDAFVVSDANCINQWSGAPPIDLGAFSVTGYRFLVSGGSYTTSGNATLTYFPGTMAGIRDPHALYDGATSFLTVLEGGTGNNAFTGHGAVYANSTGTGLVNTVGAANTVFAGNGSSADPGFTANPTVASITATSSFSANGTPGLSVTKTVRNSAGSGTCDLVYSMGLLTSSTC